MTEAQDLKHEFNYEWKTVVRAFWDKYPDQRLDFVKFSKVVDMEMREDGTIRFDRVQYVQKWGFIWAYTLEELTFDFGNQVMDLRTTVLRKSSYIPMTAAEEIRYEALKNEAERTLYTKKLKV